jgi:signal transduction histidine kinase
LVAGLSVASELFGDMASGVHYPNTFVPVWNNLIAFAFYLVVVWLVASLSSLHRELEARVRQRTAALTEELVERKRLEREILEISEREQRRIGHDLHDSLCQHLTGTALAGQVLEEKLSGQSSPQAADARHIVSLVEESIELTRSLSRGLYPVALEDSGLTPAFQELASIIEKRFQIECRFVCVGEIRFRHISTTTHLYRIAQEAISNAIRHGRARHIILGLENSGEAIKLTVQDDGRGLPENWRQSQGMGLRIMAYRATTIGAAFDVAAVPDGGTLVTVTLPHTST